jgi:hypothetical protein
MRAVQPQDAGGAPAKWIPQFDFLGLGEEAEERDIENALVRHITRFLLELGSGFAFIGRQYRLEVEGEEFFIDFLFYRLRGTICGQSRERFTTRSAGDTETRSRFRGDSTEANEELREFASACERWLTARELSR